MIASLDNDMHYRITAAYSLFTSLHTSSHMFSICIHITASYRAMNGSFNTLLVDYFLLIMLYVVYNYNKIIIFTSNLQKIYISLQDRTKLYKEKKKRKAKQHFMLGILIIFTRIFTKTQNICECYLHKLKFFFFFFFFPCFFFS